MRSGTHALFRPHPMRPAAALVRWTLGVVGAIAFQIPEATSAAEATNTPAPVAVVLVSGDGRGHGASAGAPEILPGQTVRTDARTRLVLKADGYGMLVVGPETELVFETTGDSGPMLRIWRGLVAFFNRDRSRRLAIGLNASAAAQNTEYEVKASGDERITLRIDEGSVELATPLDRRLGRAGDILSSEAGKIEVLSPGLDVRRGIQWRLYYPGILDPRDVGLDPQQPGALQASLAAYLAGDPITALALLPAEDPAASPGEITYRSALILASGGIEAAAQRLENDPTAGAGALRAVIAAISGDKGGSFAPSTASEWLAESYRRQLLQASPHAIDDAQQAAVEAVRLRPEFGFARSRLAELEFARGKSHAAMGALTAALQASPRNAHAMTLMGFVLAAQNRVPEARERFAQAIATDGGLSLAWLGHGLCLIRDGNLEGGRQDLTVAAALEPQRAVLRSYLAKAFSDRGMDHKAEVDLERARQLDPNDPTSWLYLALHREGRNRFNDAIDALEKAESLGGNRSLHRSTLLLDEDRAVRGANLARLYQRAGLADVGAREAVASVDHEYAAYHAHAFLAATYQNLADPRRIDLRYETAAVNEYLLANLLAPVGAGILSPTISLGEYSKLFESDGLGVTSLTEYSTAGHWHQAGAVEGRYGNSAFAIEGLFDRANPSASSEAFTVERLGFDLKQQVTASDSLWAHVSVASISGGDTTEPSPDRPGSATLRTLERQQPVSSLGYHHDWAGAGHTLLYLSLVNRDYRLDEPRPYLPALVRATSGGSPVGFYELPFAETYRSRGLGYGTELQHVQEWGRWTTITGARYQWGTLDLSATQEFPGFFEPYFPEPPSPVYASHFEPSYSRASGYTYLHWQVVDDFKWIAGVSYDQLRQPANFRHPPLVDHSTTHDSWNPKVGWIWSLSPTTRLRAAYTRSTTGVAPDQSFQIEPSQVAGFIQSFRSGFPDALVGATEGASIESGSATLEHQFPTRTYAALTGEWFHSRARRLRGGYAFDFDTPDPQNPAVVSFTERLRFEDAAVSATLHQLLGPTWSAGTSYRLGHATLKSTFPGLGPRIVAQTAYDEFPTALPEEESAWTHSVFASLNHHRPSGLFCSAVGGFLAADPRPGTLETRWNLDLVAGYRRPRNRGELSIGLLNVTDERAVVESLGQPSGFAPHRMLGIRLIVSY